MSTRAVAGRGKRVRITVHEREEVVEALLNRQDVTIERVPVGSVVQEPPETRRDGDTLIVPILEEVLVTETRLMLREELHIRINEQQHVDRLVVPLRTETAEVETI